ncbi:endonuclease domain-containing protein [Actinomadura sediminis]|uniref:Endonuclease domain-containing protein n=1 Tax=Actinomadura sediminis TaxID=1038904 RepID=A0ABW3ERY5_9ACTN
MKRFVETNGSIQYSVIKSKPQHWRLAYWVDATCEVKDCDAAGLYGGLVFDHCHAHGWIRAVVCPRHNMRLGVIDALVREDGMDFSQTRYGPILTNCPDCSTTVAASRHT